MSSRSWNPVILFSLLIASTLLLALHSYSLRQQLSELRLQGARYRGMLERATREKTEMRMTLGHMQRAMEKHSLRSRQRVDMEEKIRAKELFIGHLERQLAELRIGMKDQQRPSTASDNRRSTRNISSPAAASRSVDAGAQGLADSRTNDKPAHRPSFSGVKVQPLDSLKIKDGNMKHGKSEASVKAAGTEAVSSSSLKFSNKTRSISGSSKTDQRIV